MNMDVTFASNDMSLTPKFENVQTVTSGVATSIDWGNVTNKPEEFPPTDHVHSYNDLTDKPVVTNGKDGKDGKDGYTPVKGVDYFDGVDGKDGKDGIDGQDGYTPIKGKDYFDGKDGKDGVDGEDGKDGVSATHSWKGTVLTVTSASGTSSADLKGEKGDKGDKGDNADLTTENIITALGYTPSSAFYMTVEGGNTTDALHGEAASVVAEVAPKLADGSFSPGAGGSFVPVSDVTLFVNGEELNGTLPDGVYAGTYDWVTGEVISNAHVVPAKDMFTLSTTTAPGTNSQGLKYIRLQIKEGFYSSFDVPSLFVACNRYTRQDASPYFDKSIRINGQSPYVYDNDIDLDHPDATLDGLEFLFLLSEPVVLNGEQNTVVLKNGDNTIAPLGGETKSVTYPVDTKVYIDKKFAELSAALVGG